MLRAKFQATGSVATLPKRHRGKVTTAQQDLQILITHLRNRRRNARETARGIIGTHQRLISDQTVRRRLHGYGLRSRRPKVGLKISPRHRALRRAWARRHLRFTRADWANVLFTDESRYKVSGNDARARVYRRRGERFARSCVKERDWFGGGSVMVWGGISLHTKTPLAVVNGNLNAVQYQQQILRPHAIPHLHANRGMQLVQDNAPCHNARTTRQLLQQQNIRLIDWPSRSPDLNPIEHVWDELGRRVRARRQQRNVRDLTADLLQAWNTLTQQSIQTYVNSMRRRCQAVIGAGGGHTRY